MSLSVTELPHYNGWIHMNDATHRVADLNESEMRAYLGMISCNALLADNCLSNRTPQRPSFFPPGINVERAVSSPACSRKLNRRRRDSSRKHVGAHWQSIQTRQMLTPDQYKYRYRLSSLVPFSTHPKIPSQTR